MIASLIFVFTLVYLISVLIKPRPKDRLPGPPRWPIVGNIPELAAANLKYPHLALTKLAEKYGEVMGLGFGVHSACIISSYEAMKELFLTDAMGGRFIFPFAADRMFHKNLGILWSNGSAWQEMRKFTVKGLREFGFGGKPNAADITFREEAEELLSYVELTAMNNNGEFQVHHDLFGTFVGNILWRQLTGFKFAIGDETVLKLLDHGNVTAKMAGQDNVYNMFPYLRYMFPKWTQHDQHMKVHEDFHVFMKEVIETTKQRRAVRENTDPENFIEIFVDEIEKNKGNPNTNFTEEQLIILLMDVFLAGSETTGSSSTCVMFCATSFPETQKKLKEEILKVVPPGKDISLRDMNKIPYAKAFIMESMRFCDPVPIPPPRIAVADAYYKGYKIPKGTLVMVNNDIISKSKANWGDPEVFRPERFLDETGTKLVNTERFVTFGLGKRVCMGESLAWDAMFFILTSLMRKFTLKAIPGREPTLDNPRFEGTLTPQSFAVKITKAV